MAKGPREPGFLRRKAGHLAIRFQGSKKRVPRMVHLVFPLFILSLGGPPQTAPTSAAAVNVVSWDFEAAGDTDYDGWPDDWSRWRGAGYPQYVGIEIAAAPDASASCAESLPENRLGWRCGPHR